MQKFYVVKRGFKTGIFTDYNECKKQILGFSKPIFRKFNNIDDAKNFLNGDISIKKRKFEELENNNSYLNLTPINIWIGNLNEQEYFIYFSENDWKKFTNKFFNYTTHTFLNLCAIYDSFCFLSNKYEFSKLKDTHHIIYHCKTKHVIDAFKKKYWLWVERQNDQEFKDYFMIFKCFYLFFEKFKYSNLPKITFVIDHSSFDEIEKKIVIEKQNS